MGFFILATCSFPKYLQSDSMAKKFEKNPVFLSILHQKTTLQIFHSRVPWLKFINVTNWNYFCGSEKRSKTSLESSSLVNLQKIAPHETRCLDFLRVLSLFCTLHPMTSWEFAIIVPYQSCFNQSWSFGSRNRTLFFLNFSDWFFSFCALTTGFTYC